MKRKVNEMYASKYYTAYCIQNIIMSLYVYNLNSDADTAHIRVFIDSTHNKNV